MAGIPSDNLFISEIPGEVDQAKVENIFGAYGTIANVKFLPGQGKHAALVRFQTVEEAKWIVDNLNGNIPQGISTPVQVKYANSSSKGGGGWNNGPAGKGAENRYTPYGKGGATAGKGQAGSIASDTSIKLLKKGLQMAEALPGGKWSNDNGALWIGGLPNDTTDLDLYYIFATFGSIPAGGVRAMLNEDGSCKGFGFVNYIEPKAAQSAIDTLHGTELPDGALLEVKMKTASKTQDAGKGWSKDAGKGWSQDAGKGWSKGGKGGKW